MNRPPEKSDFPPSGFSSASPRVRVGDGRLSGAALVIVLSFLVILTGLIVAFLSSITHETSATSAAASAMTSRNLADSAIQLTMAQIRDSTAGFVRDTNGALLTNSPVCWASQPGAIWNWDTNGSNTAVYKLYSSTNMVATNGTYNPTNDLPPAGWWSNTALYVDLNSPVVSAQATTNYTNYPIFDPALAMTNPVTGTANSSNYVDGFTIDTNTSTFPGYYSSNPAAMPVTWLYILRDGTMIAPDASSTTTATFANAATQPSSNNPIVGRIAFWADDETCKLNINTASEGSYWATPSFTTFIDMAMGLTQPVAREYNRFPGHPASTCLSPVLWSYMGLSHPAQFLTALPGTNAGLVSSVPSGNAFASTAVQTYLTNLFSNIPPRYVLGGSYAGLSNTLAGSNAIATNALPTERLYASVDEMFFAPTNSALTNRVSNASGITQQQVNQLRFFLTAQSRAPEVNPLNLPKLCMWPVPDTNKMTANPNSVAGSTRTLYDQTIAYCSTLGSNAYYFTRYDATSPANDLAAGAVPGRNRSLYNYLRAQLGKPIPGFAGGGYAWNNKWTSRRTEQIATLFYDFIRSDINLCDSYGLNITNPAGYTWPYSYTTPPSSGSTTPVPGSGQVVPINITNANTGNTARGIGRFPTIRSGLFMFIARGANQPPLMCHPDGKPIVYLTNSGVQISTYNGISSSINASNIANVLACQAGARINPLHPWISPQTTNPGVGLINYVPQQIVRINGTNYPVLSDTSATGFNGTNYRNISNSSDVNSVYPIFSLSTNPDTPKPTNFTYFQTRTFPSVTGVSNTTVTASSYIFSTTNGLTNAFTNSNSTNLYYLADYNVNSNSVLSNSITHAGLQNLTVQNSLNGAFNIANNAYKDTNLTVLSPHATRIEGVFIPDLVNVAPGSPALVPNLKIQITGLDQISINGSKNQFNNNAVMLVQEYLPTSTNDETSYGIGWSHTFLNKPATNVGEVTNTTPFTTFPNDIVINPTNTATDTSWLLGSESNNCLFSFGGNNIVITFKTTNDTVVQTVSLNFPSANFPTPKLFSTPTFKSNVVAGGPWFVTPSSTYPLCGYPANANVPWDSTQAGYLSFSTALSVRTNNVCRQNQMLASQSRQDQYTSLRDIYCLNYNSVPSQAWYNLGIDVITADTIQSVECLYGDTRLLSCLSNVTNACFSTNPFYGNVTPVSGMNGWPVYNRNAFSMQRNGIPADCSVAGFLLPSDAAGASNNLNGISGVMANVFLKYSNLGSLSVSGFDTNKFYLHKSYDNDWAGSQNSTGAGVPYTVPTCDFKNSTFQSLWQTGGDFDNGLGNFSDGPFINLPDQGFGSGGAVRNPYFDYNYTPPGGSLLTPNRMVPSPIIFGSLPVLDNNWSVTNPSLSSGSWRTLQFSPNPNALTTNLAVNRCARTGFSEGGLRPTNTILPDHLLLDFFTMPVVEPYPISDPFSTAGKVNMNYRIAPFVQITRDAALRGVIKPVLITAVDEYAYGFNKIPDAVSYPLNLNVFNVGGVYGYDSNMLTMASNSGFFCFQYPIHLNETLRQFTNRFGANDLFRSPSEICTIWLYPARQPTASLPLNNTNILATNSSGYVTNNGGTAITYTTNNANIEAWWYNNPGTTRKGLTGDNTRERPYNYLYPRLTTKSNTYQLHYRVQTLKQTPTAHPSSWTTWIDPARGGLTDKIVSEQRGSAIIERYIDPSDTTLPDFTTNVTYNATPVGVSMDTYYRFRVINAKIFTP
jgi:uncharacterized protein (TIGR02600 family)